MDLESFARRLRGMRSEAIRKAVDERRTAASGEAKPRTERTAELRRTREVPTKPARQEL